MTEILVDTSRGSLELTLSEGADGVTVRKISCDVNSIVIRAPRRQSWALDYDQIAQPRSFSFEMTMLPGISRERRRLYRGRVAGLEGSQRVGG